MTSIESEKVQLKSELEEIENSLRLDNLVIRGLDETPTGSPCEL